MTLRFSLAYCGYSERPLVWMSLSATPAVLTVSINVFARSAAMRSDSAAVLANTVTPRLTVAVSGRGQTDPRAATVIVRILCDYNGDTSRVLPRGRALARRSVIGNAVPMAE